MKSYAFHVQTGGVGKTTLSGNIGYLLSMFGRVLIIDGHPQGSMTTWLLADKLKSLKHELVDVLRGDVLVEQATLQIRDNLSIMPTFRQGKPDLESYSETSLVSEPMIFLDLLDEVKLLQYDYVIFDLGPGMSLLEKAILLACDEVITPLTPEFLSIDGIEIFSYEMAKIQKSRRNTLLGGKIVHNKIILNNINRSFKRHNLIVEQFRNDVTRCRVFEVGQESKIAECQGLGLFLEEYHPESRVIPSLKEIVDSMI